MSKVRIVKTYDHYHKQPIWKIQVPKWFGRGWKTYTGGFIYGGAYICNGFHSLEEAKRYLWIYGLEPYPTEPKDEVVYEVKKY